MEDHLGEYKRAVEEEFRMRQGSAEKVFEDAQEDAANTIVGLAKSAPSDHIRLRAAQYILDSTVFKVKHDEDDLTKLLDKMKGESSKHE